MGCLALGLGSLHWYKQSDRPCGLLGNASAATSDAATREHFDLQCANTTMDPASNQLANFSYIFQKTMQYNVSVTAFNVEFYYSPQDGMILKFCMHCQAFTLLSIAERCSFISFSFLAMPYEYMICIHSGSHLTYCGAIFMTFLGRNWARQNKQLG